MNKKTKENKYAGAEWIQESIMDPFSRAIGHKVEMSPLVLDPFNGSGTTGQVALAHGRRYFGVELNYEYIQLTARRLNKTQINLF